MGNAGRTDSGDASLALTTQQPQALSPILAAAAFLATVLSTSAVRAEPSTSWAAKWVKVDTDTTEWQEPGVAYDEKRDRLVALGVAASGSITSEWDGTSWLTVASHSSAGPLSNTLVYDSARERVVAIVEGEETWEWDGQSWLQKQPPSRPPRRRDACVAFDSARGRVVLFGGKGDAPGYFGDTWEWDGDTWQQVATGGPPPRQSCAMAFDSTRARVVLHGGRIYEGHDPTNTVEYRDTWAWDGSMWSKIPGDGPTTSNRAMTYDRARDRVVLASAGVTWEFDGSAWEQRKVGLQPRMDANHALSYDTKRAETLLAGGSARDGLWAWDGTAWKMLGSASAPLSGESGTLVFDDVGQVSWLLILGAELWSWEGSRWREEPNVDGPEPRSSVAAAFDAGRARLVVFGGAGYSGPAPDPSTPGETWEWDGSAWTQALPKDSPSARTGAAMAYDAIRGRIVLFGGGGWVGDNMMGPLQDTWEWDGERWERMSTTGPVAQSRSHAMAFDPTVGKVVLFGLDSDTTCADPGATWAWDGTEWQELPSATKPGYISANLMFHGGLNRLFLVSGESICAAYPSEPRFGSRWDWDGTKWNPWPGSSGPGFGGTATYDAFFNQVVYFAGVDEPTNGMAFSTETWVWLGGECLSAADCPSGFCEDQVCCKSACGGSNPADCQACAVAAGAAQDGVCGPAAASRVCRQEKPGIAAGRCDGVDVSCPAPVEPPDGGTDDASGQSDGLPAPPGAPVESMVPGGGCSLRSPSNSSRAGTLPIWLAAGLLFCWARRRRR